MPFWGLAKELWWEKLTVVCYTVFPCLPSEAFLRSPGQALLVGEAQPAISNMASRNCVPGPVVQIQLIGGFKSTQLE